MPNTFASWLERVSAGLVVVGIPSLVVFAITISVQLANLQRSYDAMAKQVQDNKVQIAAIELLLNRYSINHTDVRIEFQELKRRFDLYERSGK